MNSEHSLMPSDQEMEENWVNIRDAALRKRIQNRLAQRKHRQRVQELSACQGNVAQNSMGLTATSSWNSADLQGDQAAMAGNPGRFEWVPGSRTDGTSEAVGGDNTSGMAPDAGSSAMRMDFQQDRGGTRAFNFAQYSNGGTSSPVVRSDQPPPWDMMPQSENNQQQQGMVRLPEGTNPPANLAVRSTPEHRRRRSSPSIMRVAFDAAENGAFESGSSSRQCLPCTTRLTEPSRIEPQASYELRSAPSSSSGRGHTPHYSGSSRSSRSSGILREHGIDLGEILSHTEPKRRPSVSAPSRPRTNPQLSDRCPEHSLVETSPSSLDINSDDDWNHPMGLGTAQDSHNHEYIEGLRPRVSKVVVVYFDETPR
ncbi:hypothetical protein BKA67DRAFT_574053 [Truncatella angustata]|uniref:BZIP domain-containing protein n=1 Tax=Truncatella angustata TaxID=152316 RepID=A0A9P8UI20_9PEZI|nr:uncharacterized protein BKA67DRAFT_574053 [Truncatella angustata]KAH6652459.1 hypothetical protein BKA67DRAFT_574053 [Truncatella angustata]